MGLPVVALPIIVKPERQGQHLAGDEEGRASGSCLSGFRLALGGRLAIGLPVVLALVEVKPSISVKPCQTVAGRSAIGLPVVTAPVGRAGGGLAPRRTPCPPLSPSPPSYRVGAENFEKSKNTLLGYIRGFGLAVVLAKRIVKV